MKYTLKIKNLTLETDNREELEAAVKEIQDELRKHSLTATIRRLLGF